MKKTNMDDRALNLLIATRFLKYRLKKEDCNTFLVDENGMEPDHPLDFMNDMNAAMYLLDEMKSRGYSVDVKIYTDPGIHSACRITFERTSEDGYTSTFTTQCYDLDPRRIIGKTVLSLYKEA